MRTELTFPDLSSQRARFNAFWVFQFSPERAVVRLESCHVIFTHCVRVLKVDPAVQEVLLLPLGQAHAHLRSFPHLRVVGSALGISQPRSQRSARSL